MILIYLPLAAVEALITGVILRFLARVSPELLLHTETPHA